MLNNDVINLEYGIIMRVGTCSGNNIGSYIGIQPIQCATRCLVDDNCKAVEYYLSTYTCVKKSVVCTTLASSTSVGYIIKTGTYNGQHALVNMFA